MAITDKNDGEVLTGAAWQSVIDTVEDTSTGHYHDGTDSKIAAGALQLDSMTEDTTEYSRNNTSYGDIVSYTFTPNSSNSVLLGLYIECEMKVSAGAGQIQPTIDGTALFTLNQTNTSYDSKTGVQTEPGGIPCGQASYTIALSGRCTPSGIVYVKNINITIYYLDNGVLTTNSAKFS